MTDAVALPSFADIVEAVGIDLPQDPMPVFHHFAPGIYIREVQLAASRDPGKVALVVGRSHRREHLNIMLRGRLTLMGDDHLVHLEAPQMFTAPPGRKVALVREDVAWLNVVNTDLRDVEAIEAEMFDDSPAYEHHHAERLRRETAAHELDRVDFVAACAEMGLSVDAVRALSEIDTDMAPLPYGCQKVSVRPSPIEGRGVFSSAPHEAGEVIGLGRLPTGQRTPLGRFTNHSRHPNAEFVRRADGAIVLVAARPIAGCLGGGYGEEITADYRQAVAVNLGGGK
jgi:hypothetical protein